MNAATAANWALSILVVASVMGLIVAGGYLTFRMPTCSYTPRWVTLTLVGSVTAGSLSGIAGQAIS